MDGGCPSFRRGYKRMKMNARYQKRWRGEVGSSNKLDLVTAADVLVGVGNRDGRACDGIGKDKAEAGSRVSRLIKVADNSVVAINGNQFQMGDFISDIPLNLNITEDRGGLVSGPSFAMGSGSNARADMSLDCPLKEAQVPVTVALNPGLGSVGAGRIGNDWGQKENSVRVLPGSFGGKARGRKQGPNSNRKASGPGASKEDGGAVSFSQNAGKRRLDVLDSAVLAKQKGIFFRIPKIAGKTK
ncbi:hypothetical protein RHMOL_Rhmol10G0252200 [Rhododendron molle]|uniref:Uncharacterized protein n=1 Tax=Rhododendron molle TaxID=49168 RepID=A0ACC0M733_RHOML|nr:hypothetical protein RHMOL_Rhmol10G0252200 [Rhododendron molle]